MSKRATKLPAVQKGERVAVVHDRRVYEGRVRRVVGRRKICVRVKGHHGPESYVWSGTYTYLRRNEGTTWARGWDTPEADALRTAQALTP